MQKLHIPEGERTPRIDLDPDKAYVEIVGRSLPENSPAFYAPVDEWIHEFVAHDRRKKLTITLEIEYYNTSSSKCILDLLRKIGLLCRNKWDVDVTWYYYEEDEDMLNCGMEFQSLLDYEIKIAQKKKIKH